MAQPKGSKSACLEGGDGSAASRQATAHGSEDVKRYDRAVCAHIRFGFIFVYRVLRTKWSPRFTVVLAEAFSDVPEVATTTKRGKMP